MKRPKFCQSTNSAGKRCEYRVKRHPEQGGRPLHKRGDVTWNEPMGHTASRAIFDETHAFDTTTFADSARKIEPVPGGLHNVSFEATFQTPPGAKGIFDELMAGAKPARRLYLGDHTHITIGGRDVTDSVSAVDLGFSFPPPPRDVLAAWWREKAEAEIEQTVDKAVEYGATDLIDIGRNIARLSDREVTDQEAALMGVFFYLEGKFARWRSALHEGRPVSADTLLDIGVYVRMAQRINEAGSWPGVELS